MPSRRAIVTTGGGILLLGCTERSESRTTTIEASGISEPRRIAVGDSVVFEGALPHIDHHHCELTVEEVDDGVAHVDWQNSTDWTVWREGRRNGSPEAEGFFVEIDPAEERLELYRDDLHCTVSLTPTDRDGIYRMESAAADDDWCPIRLNWSVVEITEHACVVEFRRGPFEGRIHDGEYLVVNGIAYRVTADEAVVLESASQALLN